MTRCGILLLVALATASTRAHASCRDEIGAERSAVLADQCMEASPATRPPCNVLNACDMILDEIKRGCGMMSGERPSFCKPYLAGARFVPPEPAHTRPGFDCAKARSPVETTICASDGLAAADKAMTDAFTARLKTAADAAALRAEQRAFVQERERCADPEPGRSPEQMRRITGGCIDSLTEARREELAGGGHAAWATYPDKPPAHGCTLRFGHDGSDAVELRLQPGRPADLRFMEFVFREPALLKAGDGGGFEIDGAPLGATVAIPADPDDLPAIVGTGEPPLRALSQGRMLRVMRNGKVIFRAPLASFATARGACGLPPDAGGG
ncbi:MAG TPA: lysozyme inhibitor LprI family protein [Candidatus Sulfotelmatobacter sp.]|nr:lysozyme inhibitor LprI family protein [Candidatus Sulfotelmatobacter sp.]